MSLLSNKTILAIGAVVDIAMHSGKERHTAFEVADRLQLPPRYLEPVLQALVRAGIFKGARGPLGGYRLAKAREAVSVFDISEATKPVDAENPSERFSGLSAAVVMPTLAQAEQDFASAHARISVEDLVRAASIQVLVNYKPDAAAIR